MSCGADTEANDLLISMVAGEEIEFPDIDFTKPEFNLPIDFKLPKPTALSNKDLTEKIVNGTGTFDVIMSSMRAHLKEEFQASRIVGAEYTKAYTAMVDQALGASVQFLLQKDQAMWASQLAQLQAITATVQLATVKMEFAAKKAEALTIKANFALTKLKLATESEQYCLLKNEVEVLRPLQAAGLTTDNQSKTFTLANMLPAQLTMIKEQMEAQRAQTQDTRSDGTVVLGSVGKQKDLYARQIKSYTDDSRLKVGKLFSDSWLTQKTIDEGLVPPPQFTNLNVDAVLSNLRAGVDLS